MTSGLEDPTELQERLLAWFAEAQRDFPWRSQTDPYAVLIAEKLLQQTAAGRTVVEAYERLLDRYPSASHLAQAAVCDLMEIIAPLGLKYRAAELQAMGRELVHRHGGQVPGTYDELLALSGVGEYSARAVLAFAFGEDVAVVDTNVARFIRRLHGIAARVPANPARSKVLVQLAESLVPTARSKEFNLAILDLCAQICTRHDPACSECPVREYCAYYTERQGSGRREV